MTTPTAFLKATLIPAVVILALVFAALTFLKTKVERGTPKDPGVRIEIEAGNTLPSFDLNPIGKPAINISAYASKKVILINFWASWCQACMVEMPSLVKLREAYRDRGFEVIGINVDENPEAVVPKLVDQLKITFPIYEDSTQRLSELFDVHAIPLTVVLDQNRKILYVEAGERDWNAPEVRERLEKWLAS